MKVGCQLTKLLQYDQPFYFCHPVYGGDFIIVITITIIILL